MYFASQPSHYVRLRPLAGLLIMLLAVFGASLLPGRAEASKGEKETKPAPVSPSTCSMNFADVHPADYFYDAVQYLYCAGVVSGYSDNTFRPYNLTTRGQLSKIIVLAEGFSLATAGGPHFSDVPTTHLLYAYIETAYQRGIVAGYSDGTFRPGNNVTRGQIAKMIVVASNWPLVNHTTPTFSDVPRSSLLYNYVETAVTHGVISGYSDGTFLPNSPATRGQICKIVYYATAGFHLTTQEQQMIDNINQRRAAMGRSALRPNPALTSAARSHSNDIGPAGLCQHNGTNGSSPWDRIALAGYGGSSLGEVIGCGYTTAQSVVDAWFASPSHYAIITDPNANDIGCGWWASPSGAGLQTCDTGHSN